MRLEMIVEMIFNILPNQRTCPCILSRNAGAMFLDSGATFSSPEQRWNVAPLLHHVFRFSEIEKQRQFSPNKIFHFQKNDYLDSLHLSDLLFIQKSECICWFGLTVILFRCEMSRRIHVCLFLNSCYVRSRLFPYSWSRQSQTTQSRVLLSRRIGWKQYVGIFLRRRWTVFSSRRLHVKI